MRPFKFILILICGALVVIGVVAASNPLRRSEEKIAIWLQAQTPLGSSPAEVIAYAQERKWYHPDHQGSDGRTQGEYVRGELGEYWSVPFMTYVTVFWEFDSSSRLVRVRIWKTTDSI